MVRTDSSDSVMATMETADAETLIRLIGEFPT